MEVEEFLKDVQPIGDHVENAISMPNNEIITNEIGDGNLVVVTSNEFMEVRDLLRQFHPVKESEKNEIVTVNDEIHTAKTANGELVTTATNNEFKEFDDVLENVHPIGDNKENVIHTPDDDMHTIKTGCEELDSFKNDGFIVTENFVDDMHHVQDIEHDDIRPSNDGIPNSRCEDPDAVVEKESALQDAERSVEESNGRPEGVVSSPAKESNGNYLSQSANGGEASNLVDEQIKSESPGPSGSTCTDSKPDFSKLKGRVCLDSLSVKELQETFRAAFGRETSVKDKEWLKRRISMGLSNSCHVLSMTFIIDQGNSVQIVQEESMRVVEDTHDKDLAVGGIIKDYGGLPVSVSNLLEDPENVSGERLVNASVSHDCSSEDKQSSGVGIKRVRKPTKRYLEELSVVESRENKGHDCSSEDKRSWGVGIKRVGKPTKRYLEELSEVESRENKGHDCSSEDKQSSGVGIKRVGKPTKRYIEELSEVESRENNGNLISVSKHSGYSHAAIKPYRVRSACNSQSVRRPLVTRLESFGGSGVQVPYVCRRRRSRPRENYTSFMKFQPDSMDITTKHDETLYSCGSLVDDIENTVFSARVGLCIGSKSCKLIDADCRGLGSCISIVSSTSMIMDEPEKERQCIEYKTSDLKKDEENVEPRKLDPLESNSDNDTPNVEASIGMKRKHHRPWTLIEVVNLVEGVARFGAGRWSEIKRLSFASNTYRTSVDLKDKWRNLLRASFSQSAADQGNSRKPISGPIPSEILLRVRELAKMQAQVPPILNSSKFKFTGGNIAAARSGYL